MIAAAGVPVRKSLTPPMTTSTFGLKGRTSRSKRSAIAAAVSPLRPIFLTGALQYVSQSYIVRQGGVEIAPPPWVMLSPNAAKGVGAVISHLAGGDQSL